MITGTGVFSVFDGSRWNRRDVIGETVPDPGTGLQR